MHDALVFHVLERDVVEVLSAQRAWIVGVPTGGNRSESLDIVRILAWIEHHQVGVSYDNTLEERKIGVRLHGLFIDKVLFDIVLVGVYHLKNTVFNGIDSQLRIVDNGLCLRLQCHLAKCELLDFQVILRAFNRVLGCHGRVGGIDVDGLRRINGDVDDLTGNS